MKRFIHWLKSLFVCRALPEAKPPIHTHRCRKCGAYLKRCAAFCRRCGTWQ